MATNPVHTSPRKSGPIQALTDSHNEYVPPLDFSFKGVSTFAEVIGEVPRPREIETAKKTTVKSEEAKPPPKKSDTKAVRLNFNSLDSWAGISDTISGLLTNPSSLGWLDLSFNQLTTIDQAVLNYPNLSLLYLHGNNISDLKQTDVLGGLQRLRSLTLHGNPIENQFGYRPSILGRCPHLKNFDFSVVTKSDLATAETWKVLNKGKKEGRKKQVPKDA